MYGEFREMFESLQMRCLDMRAPVDPAFVEWKSLVLRTVHEKLETQMDQLDAIIRPINEKHTLIAYGQVFILTCDWYTFRWISRAM